MNINKTIYDGTIDYLSYDYKCPDHELEDFMRFKEDFSERQKHAIYIIEQIMVVHGKMELLKHVIELARVEQGIKKLEPWVRDHVVHALLSFVLGIFINENYLTKIYNIHVDKLQWKIAGLFHDIGYPAQAAKGILKPYSAKLNEISKAIGVPTEEVIFKTVPENLENLTNSINSLELIQDRISSWDLDIDVKKEYFDLINSGGICHGMISALSVLRIIDLLYQKNNPKRKYKDIHSDYRGYGGMINWNQEFFEEDILSACSAIFLHNLPGKCFIIRKIDRKKAPVAFLLKISDCLQEWERPSLDNPHGEPSDNFDISIKDGQLIFKGLKGRRKAKIEDEIYSALKGNDIKII